jgi:hypothetical protein
MLGRLIARAVVKEAKTAIKVKRVHVVVYSGGGIGPLVKKDMMKCTYIDASGVEVKYNDAPTQAEVHQIATRRKNTKPLI